MIDTNKEDIAIKEARRFRVPVALRDPEIAQMGLLDRRSPGSRRLAGVRRLELFGRNTRPQVRPLGA